jgi:hypothetical protein
MQTQNEDGDDNPVIQAAEGYQRATTQFVTMRQIGKHLGVSSHGVGRKLKEIGLRTSDGQPSDQARDSGMTKRIVTEQGYWLDLWHQDRILAVLRPLIESK